MSCPLVSNPALRAAALAVTTPFFKNASPVCWQADRNFFNWIFHELLLADSFQGDPPEALREYLVMALRREPRRRGCLSCQDRIALASILMRILGRKKELVLTIQNETEKVECYNKYCNCCSSRVHSRKKTSWKTEPVGYRLEERRYLQLLVSR